ncbi:hypothetical protein [Agrobacterium tumefaciens]|uniref:hypothetical protein n=2 Tax=Rhizobiaceae TaxID=82115 RepID=UPI00056E5240|nr:hypothetical protein AGR1C_pAt40433 [Agrobacterium fabacearum TT111]
MSFGRWRHQLHVLVGFWRLGSRDTVQNVAIDLGYGCATSFSDARKRSETTGALSRGHYGARAAVSGDYFIGGCSLRHEQLGTSSKASLILIVLKDVERQVPQFPGRRPARSSI